MDLVLLFFFLHFVLLLLHSVETPESRVSSSVDLGVLSLLAFFVVVVVKTMMGSSVASVFSSSLLLLLLLLALLSVVQAEVLFDSNLTIGRNTLSGTRVDLRW